MYLLDRMQAKRRMVNHKHSHKNFEQESNGEPTRFTAIYIYYSSERGLSPEIYTGHEFLGN